MKHLDEATIQAFLDGELSDKLTAQVTHHLSLCDACTHALLSAEAEMADLNLAFSVEAVAPVPTQRIWARIENEIDILEAKPETVPVVVKPWWQQVAAFFTPSQVAFAGSLAAIVIVSLFGLSVIQKQNSPDENLTARVAPTPVQQQNPVTISNPPTVTTPPEKEVEEPTVKPVQIIKANYTPKPKQTVRQTVKTPQRADEFVELPLAEEKDYLDSIAQLSKNVQSSDALAMEASFRVEYEQNLAKMNQAIKAMQTQARRNPRDENSKRILLASYQNKIDLLNSVAEKSQLMATLR
jgi:ribosomal protein S15P/S13E